MIGPWSTCGQEPWYVENDRAHAYSSVGIAKDGEVKAVAVWTGEHDHADEMVAALNAYEKRHDVSAANFMTMVSRYGEAPTQEGFDQIYRRYLADCDRAALKANVVPHSDQSNLVVSQNTGNLQGNVTLNPTGDDHE